MAQITVIPTSASPLLYTYYEVKAVHQSVQDGCLQVHSVESLVALFSGPRNVTELILLSGDKYLHMMIQRRNKFNT